MRLCILMRSLSLLSSLLRFLSLAERAGLRFLPTKLGVCCCCRRRLRCLLRLPEGSSLKEDQSDCSASDVSNCKHKNQSKSFPNRNFDPQIDLTDGTLVEVVFVLERSLPIISSVPVFNQSWSSKPGSLISMAIRSLSSHGSERISFESIFGIVLFNI